MLGFKKLLLITLLSISFAQSTELKETSEREDLYLVVGSTYLDLIHSTSIFGKPLSSPDIDLTYAKSFNGQATTMGPQDAKQPNLKHIVGDIRTYDFSKYNIKGLYLECSALYEQHGAINLKQILDNIYIHLDKEAKIEIECLSFMKIYNTKDIIYSEHEKRSIEHQLELIKYAIDRERFCNYLKCTRRSPDDFKKSNPQVAKIIKIQKILDFYMKSALTNLTDNRKIVKTRLLTDTKILSFLLRKGTSISLDYPPDAPFGVLEKSLSSNPETNTSGISHIYCLSTYLAQSLTGFILYNLNIADELRFIRDYKQFKTNKDLKQVSSFKDIVFERKESLHNHRRNVWIITATKS